MHETARICPANCISLLAINKLCGGFLRVLRTEG